MVIRRHPTGWLPQALRNAPPAPGSLVRKAVFVRIGGVKHFQITRNLCIIHNQFHDVRRGCGGEVAITGRHRNPRLSALKIALFLAMSVGVLGPLPAAWAQIPLTNGVPVNGTVSQNNFQDFSIVVPPGATNLTVTLTNLSGDVDLYVRLGTLPFPDPPDCASEKVGTANEICPFPHPLPGTWFISAFGFASGTQSFTVTATFQVLPGGNTIPLTNGVPVNSTVSQDNFQDFSIVVPPGATNLTVTTTNATGDVDLYVRFDPGDQILPDDEHFDCRPFTVSGDETCPDPDEPGNIALFANPQPGTWFVSVFGFEQGTHSFTVTASFQVGGGGGDISAFVERLYQQVLGRQADPAGLQAFVQQIQTFGTVIPTVLAFFHSQEFLNRNLIDVQFLTTLYHTFLNRDPDPAGLVAFLALLQTGCRTRDTLIAALSFSDEFKGLLPPIQVSDPRVPFLAEIFAWTLNRPPDPGGFQSFLSQLQRSTAPSTITQFLHSNEFTHPEKSPVEYVSSLYLVYLGRPPDCGGLASFVALLNQGTTRDQLAAQFAGSQEFQDKLDDVFPQVSPPVGGISGTYTTSGTMSAVNWGTPLQASIPSFALTITQNGRKFTGSRTANVTFQGVQIQA